MLVRHGFRVMFLLILIGLLLFGSTQVYAQRYGETRQVREYKEKVVGVWTASASYSCPICGTSRTVYIYKLDIKLYARWRYERFNARHGVWRTTGYSEWEYLYSYTDDGEERPPCPSLSCPDGPEYVYNQQRLSTYYALHRLRYQFYSAI